MAPATQIVLSGGLTFGVPLLFALRELTILHRGRGGTWRGDPGERPTPPPDLLGSGRPVRPLPACLIPKPLSPTASRPERVRELA